jgi:hypothetical protein
MFKNPFKSSPTGSDLTSLNLNPDNSQPKSSNPTRSSFEEQLAAVRAQPVPEEINRGIKQLLDSGKHPEAVFFGGNPQTGAHMVFRNQSPVFQAIPLFSSPLLVKDYLKATGTGSPTEMQVLGINMDSLPQVAEQWRSHGIDSFFFNRCPRCPILQPISPQDKLITKKQLTFMWATNMAIRNWRAAKLVREYLGYQGDDAIQSKRATLGLLRDHVAYDNPYIHWLIALIAGIQGDRAAQSAAIETLKEFGPRVLNEMPFADGSKCDEAWVDAMAKAHVGLLASFGLLQSQPTQPQP